MEMYLEWIILYFYFCSFKIFLHFRLAEIPWLAGVDQIWKKLAKYGTITSKVQAIARKRDDNREAVGLFRCFDGDGKMADIFTRLACLIPRPHYSDIDQEGLGKRRTGTRQTFGVELKKRPNFWLKKIAKTAEIQLNGWQMLFEEYSKNICWVSILLYPEFAKKTTNEDGNSTWIWISMFECLS